jgi:sulfur carrier protein ThiS
MPQKALELTINGERQFVAAGTLEGALIVPAGRRGLVQLKAGDKIEIVTARQGG